MKKHYLLPLVSVLGGFGGLFLRRMQLETAFEPASGLPIPGAPATMALLALSLAVAVALFFLARGGARVPTPYSAAFQYGCVPCFIIAEVGVACLATGAAMMLFGWRDAGGGALALCCGLFMLLAASCLSIITARNSRNGWKGEGSVLLLAPPFACCLWLMLSYQSWARDPVVNDYMFALFAVIATMLAFYYMAAYSFGQPKETLTLFFGGLAVYFCIICLADTYILTSPDSLFFLGAGIYMLIQILVLGKNRAAPFSNPNNILYDGGLTTNAAPAPQAVAEAAPAEARAEAPAEEET